MSIINSDLPRDNRNSFEWWSKYEERDGIPSPKKQMRIEAFYLLFIFIVSAVVIVANHMGFFVRLLSVSEDSIDGTKRIICCLGAGLLGGITFSIKVFYRAIAHGVWHYDRRYWRWFSPLISLSVTSVVAAFMSHDVIEEHIAFTYFIGYFAGYFSENAVGKMQEIATVLFSSRPKQSE